jgi:hypothetical protein
MSKFKTGVVYYPKEFRKHIERERYQDEHPQRDLSVWRPDEPSRLSRWGLRIVAIIVACVWVGIAVAWILS